MDPGRDEFSRYGQLVAVVPSRMAVVGVIDALYDGAGIGFRALTVRRKARRTQVGDSLAERTRKTS